MSGQAEEGKAAEGQPRQESAWVPHPHVAWAEGSPGRSNADRQRAQVQSQATEADSTSKHGHSDLSGPPHASRAWPLSIKQENLFPFPWMEQAKTVPTIECNRKDAI